jgi:nucleotide-binding universal stress UspA family protein
VATALALAFDSKVTLLHNISTVTYAYVAAPLSGDAYQQMVESDVLKATDYLKKVEHRLHNCGVTQTDIQITSGTPVGAIRLMTDRGADLIVMETHARTGISRTIMGSVADEVVHSLDIPVLLVSARQPELEVNGCVPPFQRILVPLDGSALALQALPLAAVVAQASGATVVLLSVLPEPILVGEELATSSAGWTGRYLEGAARTMPQGVECETVVTSGEVGEAIVREAVERNCSLVMMTTHGRSGFTRMRLGSIADKVLAHAPVPLLLLHAHSAGIND